MVKIIATLEHVSIINESEKLGKMILHSDIMKEYKKSQKNLSEDAEAQRLIRDFINIKQDYEDVQRFGRYHPDFNEIMKNVRSTKRKMDMNKKVAKFKVAERNIQRILDEISECIALSVSEQIKTPKSGGILSTGCASGGCGSGGTCSCQAS